MIGIYLFNLSLDFKQVFENCKSWGIKWILTLPHIYNQNNFQNTAKKYGIKICIIFSIYHDKEYLEKNPDDYAITSSGRKAIHDWLHFACQTSTKYIEIKKKHLEELLKQSQPDMIAIDFIRFYVFWEEVYPDDLFEEIEDGCYCTRCINQFQHSYGIKIENKNPQWIKKNYLEQWTNWKCSVIEEIVKIFTTIIRNHSHNLPIMIKTVPWKNDDYNGAIQSIAGQNILKLKDYIDIISPMTYSHMIKRKPNYIHDITEELNEMSSKKVIPCIQIEKTYLDDDISIQEFEEMLKYGVKKPSHGILLFHYQYLEKDEKKRNLVKNLV